MQYSEDKVMEAFNLYTRLAARGQLDRLEAGDYFDDDDGDSWNNTPLNWNMQSSNNLMANS